MINMAENRCISCGEIIPEGALTCYKCEHAVNQDISNPITKTRGFEQEIQKIKAN